jgi:hypothetical protein
LQPLPTHFSCGWTISCIASVKPSHELA